MGRARDKKGGVANQVPTIETLEGHFSFIQDDTLRMNTVLTLQYIIFLIAIMNHERADGKTVASSMYKDMIVYVATIVEGCLHYCLKRFLGRGIVRSIDIMPTNWDTKDHVTIHTLTENEHICGSVRFKKTEKLANTTQFVVINRACLKAKILTKELFKKAETLRVLRNKIHLVGLRSVDKSYTKTDAQRIFNLAEIILKRVENKIRRTDENQNSAHTI